MSPRRLSGSDFRRMLMVAHVQLTHPHYSQKTIAEHLDLTQSTVSRYLSRAAEFIQVRYQMPEDEALAAKLVSQFDLCDAHVVEVEPPEKARQILGHTAGEYFRRHVKSGSTVSLSCGGTVLNLVLYLPEQPERELTICSLSVEADPDFIEEAPATLVGMLKAKSASTSRAFGAHLFPPSKQSWDMEYRRGVQRTRAFRSAVATAKKSEWVFVGIGTGEEGTGFWRLAMKASNGAYARRATDLNLAGEINNQPYSEDGSPLASEIPGLSKAIITVLTLDDLRRLATPPIRHRVVGVAGGSGKAKAIRAALASGLVNQIITDRATAKEMLR